MVNCEIAKLQLVGCCIIVTLLFIFCMMRSSHLSRIAFFFDWVRLVPEEAYHFDSLIVTKIRQFYIPNSSKEAANNFLRFGSPHPFAQSRMPNFRNFRTFVMSVDLTHLLIYMPNRYRDKTLQLPFRGRRYMFLNGLGRIDLLLFTFSAGNDVSKITVTLL